MDNAKKCVEMKLEIKVALTLGCKIQEMIVAGVMLRRGIM